jgi:hypothetical protein
MKRSLRITIFPFLALACHMAGSATGPSLEWLRQFGTNDDDEAAAIVTVPGGTYLAGTTKGSLDGQPQSGSAHAFLRRYDRHGNEIWTRRFGRPGGERPFGMAADGSGIYVTGYTYPSAGGRDIFLRKCDFDGNEMWSRQFGSRSDDRLRGLYVHAGGMYVAGSTRQALPGHADAGGWDAFVRKYDLDGNEVWSRQFGASRSDTAGGVAADAGGIYVAGSVKSALPGQAHAGGLDAFVRKYDAEGREIWTRQFGTGGTDTAYAIAAVDGAIYVSGSTEGTLPGQSNAGDLDAFVRKYDADGNEIWTRQFGTDSADSAMAASAHSGVVYVAGRTDGVLSGSGAGGYDVFVAKFADHPPSFAARSRAVMAILGVDSP